MSRVMYFYDSEIGIYQYTLQHPMRPHRVKMTDSLVQQYKLYDKMTIVVNVHWEY
jgi:histone deacetylase 1/2